MVPRWQGESQENPGACQSVGTDDGTWGSEGGVLTKVNCCGGIRHVSAQLTVQTYPSNSSGKSKLKNIYRIMEIYHHYYSNTVHHNF